VSPAALLVASVLIGVVNAVDTPARLAFVVDMVGRDDLMNAVALNSLVFNVARVVGPALGMLALPWVGLAGCFLLNGLTFVAVLLALAAMRLPPRVPTPARDIRPPAGGFRHLAAHPRLLLLLALAGAMAFFGWPVLALLPALSDQSLGAGSDGYAWMLSAIGFGALVGALALATFGTPARRAMLIAVGWPSARPRSWGWHAPRRWRRRRRAARRRGAASSSSSPRPRRRCNSARANTTAAGSWASGSWCWPARSRRVTSSRDTSRMRAACRSRWRRWRAGSRRRAGWWGSRRSG
jgi:Transmembrane secretion effector